MDISKTLFATMVKNARMDRHWTQEELAEKLSVSPTYLGDLERHKGTPSLSLFCKAMRLLNLSADDYVYPNGNSDSSTYKQLLRLLHTATNTSFRFFWQLLLPCCSLI